MEFGSLLFERNSLVIEFGGVIYNEETVTSI